MRQVLKSDQDVSDEFNFISAAATILLSGHAGGTWTLEVQSPSGVWVPTDLTFAEDGGETIFTVPLLYRIMGGDMGAEAWVFE